jgi:hypothetical protein
MADAVFVAREDGSFVASELARGPWDPGAQNGSAPAALLMRAFERLPAADDLSMARVTYEFLRPVPIGELRVDAEVVRPGRRVQLLDGSISTSDDIEVVRARALRVRLADSATPRTATPPMPAGPIGGREGAAAAPYRPAFAPDAIEIRFVAGAFGSGPSTAWFRMRTALVHGEDTSPLQILAAAGDFGNGISRVIPINEYLFINADLTLYIDRSPCGDWICLEAETTIAPDGIGTTEGVLYDTRGRVGRAMQALLVAPR